MRNRQFYNATGTGFSAKVDAGAGNAINTIDFRNAMVSIGTASSANMTIKVQVALGDTAPNFGAAASATNQWQYADLALTNGGGTITDGDTGVVWSGTDKVELFEVNTNGIDWMCLNMTARAAGSATATMTLTTND
jgi:hypothetical protein